MACFTIIFHDRICRPQNQLFLIFFLPGIKKTDHIKGESAICLKESTCKRRLPMFCQVFIDFRNVIRPVSAAYFLDQTAPIIQIIQIDERALIKKVTKPIGEFPEKCEFGHEVSGDILAGICDPTLQITQRDSQILCNILHRHFVPFADFVECRPKVRWEVFLYTPALPLFHCFQIVQVLHKYRNLSNIHSPRHSTSCRKCIFPATSVHKGARNAYSSG